MKERIRLFLDKENKSSSQFAEEVSVQPSGISHILSGRNKPSLDFVLKMLNTYTFINTEWLLFGKGEMYKNEKNPTLFVDNEPESDMSETDKFEIGGLFENGERILDKGNGNDETGKSYNKDDDTNVNERFSERIIIFYPDGTYKEYNRRT